MKRRLLLPAVLLLASACVYYNSVYDAEQAYERAEERRREGRPAEADVAYDSVIAKTDRVIVKHPESKHAVTAAILKARAELARDYPEAAVETTARVADLTEDPALLGLAAGLEGVARRQLGDLEAADRLLTRALESDPGAEDRALFAFHRGLARLAAGRPEQAAEDLEAAGRQERLSPDVRLDLARGLAEVGQRENAVRLTDELLRESRVFGLPRGMDAHLDSLVRRAPGEVETAFSRQLEDAPPDPAKEALLRHYVGRARELRGDRAGALEAYRAAWSDGQGRYAAEAAYRWARTHIRSAERPTDVVATRDALLAARGVQEAYLTADVARLGSAVDEFASLVEAYETRGATAAEAALRAAEIAGSVLGARRVARGLYLRYLDLAPESEWRAKAIAGAMLHADYPAGAWAEDEGADTDARLMARLSSLPASDPYRVSLQDLPRDAGIDSAYVEAERELRRRILQIRMLYDTTAVLVEPSDTAEAEDEAADEPANQPPRPEI